MMSLTRDILVEIANPDGTSSGTAEKLNHAYSYGQAPMTIATVEKMMDINIDCYVQINMDGLVSLVDALGESLSTIPWASLFRLKLKSQPIQRQLTLANS